MRVLKAGRKTTDFRPGMQLSDIKSVYIQDGLSSGDFGIAGHGERFLLSTCAQTSELTCAYCHDPHQPVLSRSRSFFNTRCISCHAVNTLTPSANHHPNSDCIACHMPQGQTADIPHVNFTDHWIRILPPKEPPAIKPHTETIGLKNIFDSDATDDLRLGIAYTQYYEAKHSHPDYLKRAVALLEPNTVQLRGKPNKILHKTDCHCEGAWATEESHQFPDETLRCAQSDRQKNCVLNTLSLDSITTFVGLTEPYCLLEPGLKKYPKYSEAHYHLGLAHAHLDNINRTILHFKKRSNKYLITVLRTSSSADCGKSSTASLMQKPPTKMHCLHFHKMSEPSTTSAISTQHNKN